MEIPVTSRQMKSETLSLEKGQNMNLGNIFHNSLSITDTTSPKVAERARRIKDVLGKVDEVAADLSRTFAKACEGKVTFEKLRVYLVGGRLKIQEIRRNSDFDFIVTGVEMKNIDKSNQREIQSMFDNSLLGIAKKYRMEGMIDTRKVEFVTTDEEFSSLKKQSPSLLLHELIVERV